jgi:hypothetical protein
MRILEKRVLQVKIIEMITLGVKYNMSNPISKKLMDSTNFTLHVLDYPMGHVPDYTGAG